MKSITRVDAEELRGLSFREKFKKTFGRLTLYAGIAVLSLAVTVIASVVGLNLMYNSLYQQERIQGEIRIDIQALSKCYLWALSSPDEEIRAEQLQKAEEKFPDFESNLAELEAIYSGSQDFAKIRSDLSTVQSNGQTLGAMFTDGSSSDDIFFYFNDVLYPSIDVVVKDFKAVSNETTENGAVLYRLITIVVIAALVLTVCIVVVVLLYLGDLRNKLTAAVMDAAEELKDAAGRMANGELDIEIEFEAEDELGELAKNLGKTTESTAKVVRDISETLDRIADGDFTHGSEHPDFYRGDYIPIRDNLDEITKRLSEAMGNVSDATAQVSRGATDMREGASGLAEGATDQAAAIEELTASVQTVNEQTQHVAESANNGGKMILRVQDDMAIGTEKMGEVTQAMDNIMKASKEIEQIANTIEDISSETQLLSLNASIEAARAGESGRGFAVVAESISKLAASSSEAAQNTQELINGALSEIEKGNNVVRETQEAMTNAQNSVNDVVAIIQETGEIASQQAENMKEISGGIEQISNVIQDNTATAQESSAVSAELSEQSESLSALIGQFRLRG